jgi:hypothetical protein
MTIRRRSVMRLRSYTAYRDAWMRPLGIARVGISRQ